jgi:transcriptional regulator with XRE-family HTH domain
MATRTKSDRRTLSSSLSGDVLQWLLSRGHTQADVARLLGVSEAFVSLVKSRERALTLDHLESLTAALGVPLGAMMIQVTERDAKDPETRALLDATDRLLRKCDAVADKLRARLDAQKRAG